MTLPAANEVTQLLKAWTAGDEEAFDKTTPLVSETLSRPSLTIKEKRQLLRALQYERPCALLIDELDKVGHACDAVVVGRLSVWRLSIPKLGTIQAAAVGQDRSGSAKFAAHRWLCQACRFLEKLGSTPARS